MNICVIGNNLTSLVLSKALVNKKINVTIFYNYEKVFLRGNYFGIKLKYYLPVDMESKKSDN